MGDKVLTLLQREDKHVAGVFTSEGLYASCLPRKTEDEAIRAVDGYDLPETSQDEYIEILNSIFDIYDGKKDANIEGVKLDFADLSPKQVAVYKATMTIPYGKTLPYGIVAEYAGLPGAARFVGNVMASNRLAPIVPCHRVVSSTGIGGYGDGIDTKIEFLKREGAIAD
ncbi:MAG: MGMT family protein [Candidatus Thorarchaeota archaeon]|nr:MAG: MGMT family protein [Candidatus Thorarchaeota archaeon]